MVGKHASEMGLLFPGGTRITHGSAGNIKKPFKTMPVIMHEMDSGGGSSFRGQFGFIPFRDDFRLPRHVHMTIDGDGASPILVSERILVVGGVGLVELNGEVLIVAPGTLVDIAAGVPHTWTACPAGIRLPDQTVSDGSFLMIYEYSDHTGFFPTESVTTLTSPEGYQPYDGDLERIRFPKLSIREVAESASLVWNKEILSDLPVAG